MAETPPSVASDLILRLPRTFAPAFSDQLSQWALLFPAERRQLQGEIDALEHMSGEDFKRLFAPILAIEAQMELPRWAPGAVGISVKDAGLLARSPVYGQWRQEVAKVFATLDRSIQPLSVPRLIACVLPDGLPPAASPWTELSQQGTWISLDGPFSSVSADFARSLAARQRPREVDDLESTWIFACTSNFTALADSPGVVVLDWTSLAGVRREFLGRLNRIRRDLKSVDDTNQELRRTAISPLVPRPVAARPQVREFLRTLLLSGNGSLVFPNSFVQWGASEALRRAQPQVLLAFFGVRQKLKPFSSSVLFEDQHRANPAADEDDPAGSLIDDLELAEYVYLSSRRFSPYSADTVGVMAIAGLNRVLLLGTPPDGMTGSMKAPRFTEVLLRWIESGRQM